MSTITREDYDEAFDRYRRHALESGAVDVIQCGSVNDPGISDIDCILVLKAWRDGRPRMRMFNPESFSPLFTHGPFVVTTEYLDALLRYTTLRPIGSEANPPSGTEPKIQKVIVAGRQSLSWLHLSREVGKPKRRDLRQTLLLLKSAVYTLQECLLFSRDAELSLLEVSRVSEQLTELRQGALEGNIATAVALAEVIDDTKGLLAVAGENLTQWILMETSIDRRSTVDAVQCYSTLLTGRQLRFQFRRTEYLQEAQGMRELFRELVTGYRVSGAGWKGAEFPFHVPAHHTLGWRIWPRRIVKRIVRLRSGR